MGKVKTMTNKHGQKEKNNLRKPRRTRDIDYLHPYISGSEV